jgi:tRNA (mo5U34)-methyltransferase
MATVQADFSGSSEPMQWWHRFEQLLALNLPDLTGKTVLDVGAGDGYFSFAAERLGASRVVSIDNGKWGTTGGKRSFERLRKALASHVEDLEMNVLDISPETVGRFDVVLFLGMLFHMRHPLLALERVASVSRELLIVETLVDITFRRAPVAAFHPSEEAAEKSSSWGPNRAAVLGMLEAVGFAKVVAFPLRRLTAAHLVGLPARAKLAGDLVHSTPKRARQRLVKDFARHALTRSHLVVHGSR